MSSWTADQLQAFADSDDLHIAPDRPDGTTPGTPTWIRSVVVGDGLRVRACNGTASRWFGAARQQGAGQIQAAGSTLDVTFEPVTADDLQAVIDGGYRDEYAGSPYLPTWSASAPALRPCASPRSAHEHPHH